VDHVQEQFSKFNPSISSAKAMRLTATSSSAGSYLSMTNRIEDYVPLIGKVVTFSFMYKVTNTDRCGIRLYYGVSAPVSIITVPEGVWTKVIKTITVPSNATQLAIRYWAAEYPSQFW